MANFLDQCIDVNMNNVVIQDFTRLFSYTNRVVG